MTTELEQLKSVLRSLVVSSPTQMDARALARDFRTMQGESLPLQRYGYRDFATFLQERCCDCFLLSGPSSNPVLTLIVPDSLKHIDEHVQKQKRAPTAKFKAKRTSVPEAWVMPKEKKYVPPHQRPIKVQPIEPHNNINHNNDHSPRPTPKPSNNNADAQNIQAMKTEKQRPMEIEHSNHEIEAEEISNRLAVQNFFRKRMPLVSLENTEEAAERRPASVSAKSREDDDSGRQTSSSGGSSKRMQLEALSGEISDLLEQHPAGFSCTNLLRVYRERYGRDIPYERLGHRSVAALLRAAEGAPGGGGAGGGAGWRLTRPPRADDWFVQPLEAPIDTEQRGAERRGGGGGEEEPGGAGEAMPGIDFEEDVFPADCLHYVESIPAAGAGGAGAGALLEVCVGEVYSPSHLWLIRLGPQHDVAMENIMDEMNVYFTSGSGAGRALALGAVRAGHYVAALFEGDWHRAIIVQLLDCDTVKVRHVDYGTVARAAVSELRPLPRRWAALPAQALRARLWGLRPRGGAARWPLAAAAALLARVSQRRLVAATAALTDGVLEVVLVDTTGDDDLNINDELVRDGLADREPAAAAAPADPTQEAPWRRPAFAALESGDAPNYGELLTYRRLGLDAAAVPGHARNTEPAPRAARRPLDHIVRRLAPPPPPRGCGCGSGDDDSRAGSSPRAGSDASDHAINDTQPVIDDKDPVTTDTNQIINYAMPVTHNNPHIVSNNLNPLSNSMMNNMNQILNVTNSTMNVTNPMALFVGAPRLPCYSGAPRPPPRAPAPGLALPALDCEVFLKLSLVCAATAARHLQAALARAGAGGAGAGGVALAALDCEVFSQLVGVDVGMAVQHMRGALQRAPRPAPPPPPAPFSTLNPAAAEFRAFTPAAGVLPPPGFYARAPTWSPGPLRPPHGYKY